MRRSRSLGPLLFILVLVGCGARPPTQFVVGPVGGTQTEIWEGTLAALEEAHYEPDVRDAARGEIAVPSHILGSRSHFVIQLYREGWVQVTLEMSRRWRRAPDDLTQEELTLAMALRRALLDQPASAGGRENGGEEEEPDP